MISQLKNTSVNSDRSKGRISEPPKSIVGLINNKCINSVYICINCIIKNSLLRAMLI